MARFPWWLVLGACLVPCIYLPTLTNDFDFSEDSCLVYPRTTGVAAYLDDVWATTRLELSVTGPFRPVTWAHWKAAASLFGPDALARRIARLCWAMFATATLLLFLREMGASPPAALLTAAFAMWNWLRGEIWIGLGMPEAYGMPYALLALVCATRAARSERPFAWDAAGLTLLLLCLGIKNVYIALIPALVWLRLSAGERSWRDQLLPASLYALLAIGPIIHVLLLKLDPKPLHYRTEPSLAQAVRLVRTIAGASSLYVLLPTFALIGVALVPFRRENWFAQHRVAIGAAVALLLAGIVIYVPMVEMYGRYTMPAVWGVDVLLALLLTALFASPALTWRRLAMVGLAVTLAIVGWRSLARQDEVIARNRMLWAATRHVEERLPAGTRLALAYAPMTATTMDDLSLGECFHLMTHLRARHRLDADLALVESGTGDRVFVLGGTALSPGPDYAVAAEFRAGRVLSGQEYRCRLWRRRAVNSDP